MGREWMATPDEAIWGCREMMKHVSRSARRVGLLRQKLQAAEVWADRRKLSGQARLKIRAYYADVWTGHAGAL